MRLPVPTCIKVVDGLNPCCPYCKKTSGKTTAARKIENLAARNTPNQKLIYKANARAVSEKSKGDALKRLDNFGKASKGGVAKTMANKAQDAAKSEKPNEIPESENTQTPNTNVPVIYNTGSRYDNVILPGTY